MEHEFTTQIKQILASEFGKDADAIYDKSPLLSFVIKSVDTVDELRQKLRERAERQYSIKAVVDRYMACIEEIINLTVLQERFREAVKEGYLRDILDEIITQSRVEFSYGDDST